MVSLFQSAQSQFLKNETAVTLGLISELECRMKLYLENPDWDSVQVANKALRFEQELSKYCRKMETLNQEFQKLNHEIEKL